MQRTQICNANIESLNATVCISWIWEDMRSILKRDFLQWGSILLHVLPILVLSILQPELISANRLRNFFLLYNQRQAHGAEIGLFPRSILQAYTSLHVLSKTFLEWTYNEDIYTVITNFQIFQFFSIYLILSASLDPGVNSASKSNGYHKQKNNVYGEKSAAGA
jgi:hypothetical protein